MRHINSPLIFFRHGCTDWNVSGRFQGQTDTTLSDLGREQCIRNGLVLRTLLSREIIDTSQISFVSSPLIRALDSAGIIVDSSGLGGLGGLGDIPIETNVSFMELKFGRWEGLTSVEIKELYYEERRSRKVDAWNFCPLGGESLSDRSASVISALGGLSGDTVIVSHAGIIRILFHCLGGMSYDVASNIEISHTGALVWNGRDFFVFDEVDEV